MQVHYTLGKPNQNQNGGDPVGGPGHWGGGKGAGAGQTDTRTKIQVITCLTIHPLIFAMAGTYARGDWLIISIRDSTIDRDVYSAVSTYLGRVPRYLGTYWQHFFSVVETPRARMLGAVHR